MRLTEAQEQAILEAYREWDGSGSVQEFCARNNVTKQTLYNLLNRHQEPTKLEQRRQKRNGGTRPGNGNTDEAAADFLIDKIAEQALRTILEENRHLHIAEYRIELLEQRLRDLGVDPDSI